ncbi:MAG: cytochrome-c peroxidase [Leptospiraceae bacterium]|nr:cytochrome-c peroxidase [Leptospiraceae bacterium]
MKYTLLTLLLFFLVYCGPSAKTQELHKKAKLTFGVIPDKMPGSESDTPALIDLGKKLYFEKGLSKNDSQSCNSCHNVLDRKGGVDNLPTSPGAFGKNGDRNSPTVLNAGFHIAQFWDGRAADLAAQAKGPVLNPVEMGMPSEKAVEAKIEGIAGYKELFEKAFPTEKVKVTYDNIAKAIASFERTLKTKDRFDDFLSGNFKALSNEEVEGLDLFMSTGCTGCHNGPLMGGNSFRKMGERNPYENKEDLGRFNITKQETDKYVFKVQSLRNVALTAPYFHDGKATTLEQAVKKMAYLQLNVDLPDQDVSKIVSFLKTLTDKERDQ